MKKIDVLSGLLVIAAVIGGLNFVSNRASFFGVSQTVQAIKEKVYGPNYAASSVGYLKEFTVTCAASPTLVKPPAMSALSIACKCESAVAWGSDSVAADDYQSDDWGGNVREAYCFGADTACKCIALVTSN